MKKILISIASAALCLVFSVGVYADEQSDLENRLARKQSEIAAMENTIKQLEEQKKSLSDEIVTFNNELQTIQTEMEALSIQMDQITIELEKAQADEDKQRDLFYNRLRVMYENGTVTSIESVIDSDDIMSAAKKLELMKQISEYDRELFDEVAEIRERISDNKAELDKTADEYNKRKQEFDEKIAANNTQIQTIDTQLAENKASLKKLNDEKKEIETSLHKLTYSGKLLSEGEKYLGFPYVWGGSTPETSFDCSGFVCWAVTHSGVYNLPRTTAQGIYDQCKHISREEAQEGDIIFFTGTYQSSEPVTHVGIYAGNNRMLHCGNPIQYTSTNSDYWTKHFYAFGRLGR